MRANVARVHVGVTEYTLTFLIVEAAQLGGAGGGHALPDGAGDLAIAAVGHVAVIDSWHLDVNVYPVEKRSGKARAVALKGEW